MPLVHVCPGCGGANGRPKPGRCRTCARPANRGGESDSVRGVYDSRRWREETRPAVLERADYRCERCGLPPRVTDPLTVAHRTPVAELLAQGRDPFAEGECECLHRSCHGREDGAGAGRDGSHV